MKLPHLFKGRRRLLYLRLLANGLLQAGAAVVFAFQASRLFDAHVVAGTAPADAIWMDAALLLGLSLVIAALRRGERVDAELFGQLYVRDIRKRLFARVLRSQQRARDGQRKGLLLLRFVGDLNAIRQWVSLGLARLSVAAVAVTVVLAALAQLHAWFALMVAGALLLTAAAMLWQGRRVHQSIQNARRRQANLAANLTEKISNATLVQLFDQGDHEQRYLARQNRRLIETVRDKAAAIGSLRAIVDAGAAVAFVGCLLLAAHAEGASPGAFVAVLSLVGFLAAPLRDLGRAQEYWLAHGVAIDKLQRLASRLRPMTRRQPSGVPPVTRGSLQIRKLQYATSIKPLTAQLAGGQRVALVGANGAGKSTLLALLAGLIEPGAGSIRIDGIPLKRMSLAQQRKVTAFVGAEVPLIRGSVRKNLTYGLHSVDAAHLQRVLHECGVTELLERLPQGLDTRVDEGGSNLSQGERARLSLARALLRKPLILLLDEAEAHLDVPSIQAMHRALAAFPGTLVMATHRRESIELADQVWHLHQGELIARGTPAELLSQAGPTRQLLRTGLRLVG